MKNPFYARLLAAGSLLGALGVICGAFGAHFLKNRLAVSELDIIRTGVLYLFIHVLIIFVVSLLSRDNLQSRLLKTAGIFFVLGIVMFSGSLFIIATQSLTGINASFIGVVTPMGGLCFILGWTMLFIYAFSLKS